ncbi:hypothetical protein ACFPRL_10430 [Pseudoclavibacter helvolus]
MQCAVTRPSTTMLYVQIIGPSTNGCTSQGWLGVGTASSTDILPASGPVFVSSPTPPRENAARAKNLGYLSIADCSSSGLFATIVSGTGTPASMARRLKLALSCRRASCSNPPVNTLVPSGSSWPRAAR